jgi:hypothetical protein
MRLSRLAGLIGAGALMLAVAAPASAASGNAMIRVIHGSPDAPAVDVFANGGKVAALSNLAFGHITSYVAVPAGTYSIKVCATADNTVCPIGPVDLTFAAGKSYTIAASDLLAQIKANVFVDAPMPVSGKAQVRVVHLSADTPAVDVLTQDKATTVVGNLAYPNATGYLTLTPGSYDLIVCAHADHSVCPLDPGALDLASGTSYSVFAVGSLTGNGDPVAALTAVVAVDSMAAPATDAVSASPTASTGSPITVLLLAAGAAFGLVASLRFATARARSR